MVQAFKVNVSECYLDFSSTVNGLAVPNITFPFTYIISGRLMLKSKWIIRSRWQVSESIFGHVTFHQSLSPPDRRESLSPFPVWGLVQLTSQVREKAEVGDGLDKNIWSLTANQINAGVVSWVYVQLMSKTCLVNHFQKKCDSSSSPSPPEKSWFPHNCLSLLRRPWWPKIASRHHNGSDCGRIEKF